MMRITLEMTVNTFENQKNACKITEIGTMKKKYYVENTCKGRNTLRFAILF